MSFLRENYKDQSLRYFSSAIGIKLNLAKPFQWIFERINRKLFQNQIFNEKFDYILNLTGNLKNSLKNNNSKSNLKAEIDFKQKLTEILMAKQISEVNFDLNSVFWQNFSLTI